MYSQEELEKLLIGSILADGNCLCTGSVDLRDLKTIQARECYSACDNLFRDNKPVNIQTVVMEAGVKYATWISEAFDIGLKSNFIPILNEIQERGIKERISLGIKQISNSIGNSSTAETIDSLRELYNSEILNSEETGTIQEAVSEFDRQSDYYAEKGNIGISTGFNKWDAELITYEPGHLWMVGGFTSVGKTATALEFIGRIGESKGVAIFSLEMTKPQIISRMISRITGYSSRMILSGKLTGTRELQSIAMAKQSLLDRPIFVFRKAREWKQIVNCCRMLKMQGCIDVAIFDYAQNIKTDGKSGFEKMENLSRGCQDLVQDLEITGIMLSQISQQQNRDDSGSAEYKGSGGFAEVADIGLHLSRPKDSKTELLVEMRKNRHGPKVDMLLEYQDHYTILKEVL